MNYNVDGMNEKNKAHIRKALSLNVREDGRDLLDYRPISVEYGVVGTAEGSARVKIGETEVIAGVKLSIEKPFGDQPENGVVMVGVELLPLSSPDYELGPPGEKAVELARVTDRGIRESKALDTEKLCIEAGEKVWFVAVDNCPINDAGNLQDAMALATLAALQNAVFPTIGERGIIDYKAKTSKKLPLVLLPIAVTVYKTGESFLVDPSTDEELIEDAHLTATVQQDGRVCSLQKGGPAPLTPEDIIRMIEIACEKAAELRKNLQ